MTQFSNDYLDIMAGKTHKQVAAQAAHDARKGSAYRMSIARYLRNARKLIGRSASKGKIIAQAKAQAQWDVRKNKGERLRLRAQEFLAWVDAKS